MNDGGYGGPQPASQQQLSRPNDHSDDGRWWWWWFALGLHSQKPGKGTLLQWIIFCVFPSFGTTALIIRIFSFISRTVILISTTARPHPELYKWAWMWSNEHDNRDVMMRSLRAYTGPENNSNTSPYASLCSLWVSFNVANTITQSTMCSGFV